MSDPFLICALPRSRTRWLSEFLSYGDYECVHDHVRFVRSIVDLRAWLSQDFVGASETAAAPWWRLAQAIRPELRILVVRRPVEDVLASVLAIDMRGVCHFDSAVLLNQLQRHDRRLDKIERFARNVLSVNYDDLEKEHTCARVFEHCLPYYHNPEWWKAWAPLNRQPSMPHLMRYYLANRLQMKMAALSCKREMRRLLSWRPPEPSDGQLTIQEEDFDIFWRDGQHLFADHAAEVGERDGAMLNVNVFLARELERKGATQIMTARFGGQMVGYLVTLISPTLEDRDLMSAMQNTFYVAKSFRGIGPKLQSASLQRLRERGIGEVVLRAGVRGDGPRLAAMYERLGATEYGRLFNLPLRAA